MSTSRMMSGSPILMGNNTIPGIRMHKELKEVLPEIFKACTDFGLDFFPTIIELVPYDVMSELASYGGFPVRYPHWSFGMEYEQMSRGYEYGQYRISEMVTNVNPCVIYCMDSNTLVNNINVIVHALGHNHFFKNNIFFSMTNRGMMNKMANHGTRIRKYMARWGKETVTAFIDHCLRLDTLIDPAKAWQDKVIKDVVIRDEREYEFPDRIRADHNYMDDWVNSTERIEKQKLDIQKREVAKQIGLLEEPDRDIFGFLKENAPLKPWQQDIISMLYEESLYFAPQRATKTGNEGAACGKFDTLVLTNQGYIKLGEIVEQKLDVKVHDGVKLRSVIDWFKFENRKCFRITTKRGYVFEGSDTHRMLDENFEWNKISDLKEGSKLYLTNNNRVWTGQHIRIYWTNNKFTKSLLGISEEYNISRDRLYNIISNNNFDILPENIRHDLEIYLSEKELYKIDGNSLNRKEITVPKTMSEDLASFCGYLIGDGHISDIGRSFGLTTGDEEQADDFIRLTKSLFGLDCSKKWDSSSKNGRWRIKAYSKNLRDFLVYLGHYTGVCAQNKQIPAMILSSPQSVMSAFLRSYFDCDGCASLEAGIILSTSSSKLAEQVQIILLNYGILSTKRIKVKEGFADNYHVIITSESARIFYNEIGFGLSRKQNKLKKYINKKHMNNTRQSWSDEVVSIEAIGEDTVYDISVEGSHRYAAQGFINHNSYIDFSIMCRKGLCALGQKDDGSGIVEYAKHKAAVLGGEYSQNPYKMGFELLMDIEDRWDKGKFGREYEECQNIYEKEKWDKKLGLGKEKVFEVIEHYNDILMIAEFFTPEFCEKKKFFEYVKKPNGEWEISSRDFRKIKKKLLQKYTNGGLPDVRLVDHNHRGDGWMLLQHYYDGMELYIPYVNETLESLYRIWQNKVALVTKNKDGEEIVFLCTGPGFVKKYNRDAYEEAFM
jgi:stage V sporulation protein R